MFVFGILGVAFLSVGLVMGYFALREPALVPSFGTIALVFVPMGALFVGMTLWSAVRGHRTRRIRAQGVPGVARIVDISDTGVLVNEKPLVDLELEIRPSGGSPYPARHRATLPRFAYWIAPGVDLPVKVDRTAPDRFVLEWRPLAPVGLRGEATEAAAHQPRTWEAARDADRRRGTPAPDGGPTPDTDRPAGGASGAGAASAAFAPSDHPFAGLPTPPVELLDPRDVGGVSVTGVPARATVERFEPTGVSIRGDEVYRFELSVRPDDSEVAYRIRRAIPVSPLAATRLRTGASFPARIDPVDPQKLALDWSG